MTPYIVLFHALNFLLILFRRRLLLLEAPGIRDVPNQPVNPEARVVLHDKLPIRVGHLVESTRVRRGYLPLTQTSTHSLFSSSLGIIPSPDVSRRIFACHAEVLSLILFLRNSSWRIIERIGLSISSKQKFREWPAAKRKLEDLNAKIMQSVTMFGMISASSKTARKLYVSATLQNVKMINLLEMAIREKSLQIFGEAIEASMTFFAIINDMLALVIRAERRLTREVLAKKKVVTVKELSEAIKSGESFFQIYRRAKSQHSRACNLQVNAIIDRAVSINRDSNISLVRAQLQLCRCLELVTALAQVYTVNGNYQMELSNLFAKQDQSATASFKKCAKVNAELSEMLDVANMKYRKRPALIDACDAWSRKPNLAAANAAREFSREIDELHHSTEKMFDEQKRLWEDVINKLAEL